MKAVAYQTAGKLDRADSLVDVELDKPVAKGRDLLVQVEAISVNPVDYKIRNRASADEGTWKVLGWDAVGTVVETGEAVQNFKTGDKVWYAGSLIRQGANSEYHLVDERIVGQAPVSLAKSEAAALPLTSITAGKCSLTGLMCASLCPVPQTRCLLLVGQAVWVLSLSSSFVH